MISTYGIILIVAVFIIKVIVNYCVLQETNAKLMKISDSSLFLAIRFKFSVMFSSTNLQRGNVFTLVFVIYIAIEIIMIMMSSIIKILEILLSHSPTFYGPPSTSKNSLFLCACFLSCTTPVCLKHYTNLQ